MKSGSTFGRSDEEGNSALHRLAANMKEGSDLLFKTAKQIIDRDPKILFRANKKGELPSHIAVNDEFKRFLNQEMNKHISAMIAQRDAMSRQIDTMLSQVNQASSAATSESATEKTRRKYKIPSNKPLPYDPIIECLSVSGESNVKNKIFNPERSGSYWQMSVEAGRKSGLSRSDSPTSEK